LSKKGCYDKFGMKNPQREKTKYIDRMVRFFRGWLLPGIGVKRWLLVILFGTTLIGIGLGVLILDFYRNAPDTWWLPLISAISLRELPRLLRVIIFGGLGISLVLFGIWRMNRGLMEPFLRPGENVADALRQHRQRERGPKIVAIGGGHGMATVLRGLKTYTFNLTAVVSVADDGGSSGILRRELGILPPGDIRNCLAALSDDEALIGQLFQYRFSEDGGFQGHSFGNLFISVLAEITGSFEQAVAESGRVLAIHGEVLPSTLDDVHLQADVILPLSSNEVRIQGESKIPETKGRIRRIWLEPSNPPAFPKVIQAILNADIIIIGPGSIYTSILPNLLVPDLVQAIRASRGYKIYICNLASQPGETDNFTCGDHIQVIEQHVGDNLFNVTICNNSFKGELPKGVQWVQVEANCSDNYPIYLADLVSDFNPVQHDSQKLARVVLDLFQEKTGPLVE
jgi:uncharacterized cofD-like protein